MTDKGIQTFLDWWFDKQPGETFEEAVERRVRTHAKSAPLVREAIEVLEEAIEKKEPSTTTKN